MLLLSLTLKDQIDCALLCDKIQRSLNRISPIHDMQNKVLSLYLSDISSSQDIVVTPLLEDKRNE